VSVFPGRFTCLYQQRFGTKMFNLRVGKFFNVVSYLQEAIDYCQAVSKRGVRARLISRIVASAPYTSDYPKSDAPKSEAAEAA